jgi:ABC-type lipoprotein export system ATPase subunit
MPDDPTTGTATGADSQDTSNGVPVFEARGLCKEFDEGQVTALDGVDFKIFDGDFVSIIGTSGSGKSTLLNMLGDLDHQTSGTLLFKGESIADLDDPAQYRAQEIGFIFQGFHLLPTFTVEENVQIPMFGQPWSLAERKDRAAKLIDSVGLSHRKGHLPSKLSGGERQRAAIARSLVNNPGALLADEPTGNLDSKNAAQVMELLSELQAEHQMTMILVTHDLEVAGHASRLIQMKDGVIVSDSTTAEAPGKPSA